VARGMLAAATDAVAVLSDADPGLVAAAAA
jgi:hypothetical protein